MLASSSPSIPGLSFAISRVNLDLRHFKVLSAISAGEQEAAGVNTFLFGGLLLKSALVLYLKTRN